MTRFFLCFLLLLTPFSTLADDASVLRSGVTQIAAPGLPGSLCVFGPSAFAVAAGKSGKFLEPVVAASKWGSGRLVAFGHTGYFDGEALGTADTGKFLTNAVRWAGGRPDVTVGVRKSPQLLAYFRTQRVAASNLTGWNALKTVNVLCTPVDDLTDADVKVLMAFVKNGGGIVAVETGWGWLQLHPNQTLATHGGSKLFAPTGIVWTDGTLDKTSTLGFSVTDAPSKLLNASDALAAVLSNSSDAQAMHTLTAARALPSNDKLLRPKLAAVRHSDAPNLARLRETLETIDAANASIGKLKASPLAANFPGDISRDAPRVTKVLTIDTSVPDWHSTGLYAAPGEKIDIDAPPSLVKAGFAVRIGAHTDALWNLPKWERAPEISRVFPVNAPKMVVANAFGGLIYVVVPPDCKLGTVSVEISHAVAAPYFVAGQTSPSEWLKLRQSLAPWAELAGKNVILSVPSRVVRNLENPDALMAYWDRGMADVSDLAQIPRRLKRPERYVTDRQISAGYMHSGYPIMTGLDVAEAMTNLTKLTQNEHGGVWGFWHEVGHNRQQSDWTFDGTGEVTNNLFALYVLEKEDGITDAPHPAMATETAKKRLEKYLADGAKYDDWKRDPFLALTFYRQLQQAFGWDAYKKVFAEYRTLTDAERPKTDAEKRDQWLTRFSRVAGKSLGPFFTAWGVPTSEKARASIAELPMWMPGDFPGT